MMMCELKRHALINFHHHELKFLALSLISPFHASRAHSWPLLPGIRESIYPILSWAAPVRGLPPRRRPCPVCPRKPKKQILPHRCCHRRSSRRQLTSCQFFLES